MRTKSPSNFNRIKHHEPTWVFQLQRPFCTSRQIYPRYHTLRNNRQCWTKVWKCTYERASRSASLTMNHAIDLHQVHLSQAQECITGKDKKTKLHQNHRFVSYTSGTFITGVEMDHRQRQKQKQSHKKPTENITLKRRQSGTSKKLSVGSDLDNAKTEWVKNKKWNPRSECLE